ncbi:hypothetical protein [Brevundimonas sp. SORGH_AS_0993]|uniref:hypothetical protein n=1 Tax=Brevundimonas sp. SORGH_AS_0993 TaxID=3041794 RepID=UPI0027882A16|nr:hypothetical protein [Brevundimonas sp. SORGH_AS_0993]MDQ1153920.1 hypothetical protein [Brevundimonas sp. SORGH_AS_0993]
MRVSRSDGPDWRGKVGLAGLSVAFNAALVAALSYAALGFEERVWVEDEPTILLDIQPRRLLPDERPRPPVVAPPQAQPNVARSDAADRRTPITSAAPGAVDQPAPLRPRLAAPAPVNAPSPPGDAWRVDPADRQAAMARALRQGLTGCASPELLNDAERRRCRDDFGRRAAAAPPIHGTGNPERDARFAREGARRLAEWEMMNRPLSGGVGVVGPADCVGSNFGTGCAGAQLNPSLAPDSTRNIQTRRDGHRASGAPITPGAAAPMERWKD